MSVVAMQHPNEMLIVNSSVADTHWERRRTTALYVVEAPVVLNELAYWHTLVADDYDRGYYDFHTDEEVDPWLQDKQLQAQTMMLDAMKWILP